MGFTIASVGAIFAVWLATAFQDSRNEPTGRDRAENAGIRVRLVDQGGQPVEGAEVGLGAASGDVNFRETGWEYFRGPSRSDRDGVARLEVDARTLNGLSLTARHQERRLIAVENLDATQGDRPPTLTMLAECRVVGRLRCKELEGTGSPLRGIMVNVRLGSHLAAEFWSMEPEFEFFLPPGKYNLELGSEPSGIHTIVRPLVVPAGVERLELPTIELHRAEYSRLEGHIAPELREVAAWKNGSPGKLADLRGKVILLDFWGWWCGSCVRGMPELFRLHDKYRDKGLVIISVHVDYDEEDGVVTAEELGRKLGVVRESVWGGRDLPFPVALTTPRAQLFGGDAGRPALCAAAADYGVQRYPTMILIDKRGRVAGRVNKQDCVERIEAALSEH